MTYTWSRADDAKLRVAYQAGGIYAAAAEFPDRSHAILYKRANKLGVRRRPRWTRADDAKLRSLWGVEHIRTIARQLGRTVITVYYRVDVLGLQRGCPQGWEYITTAATRCGYTPAQLVRILRWAGVRVMRAQSRCLPGARRHYRIVEIGDAEDAVASWLAIETLQADVDVGDWQAPPGSEAWAQAVRLRMLSVVKTLDLYPESMRSLVQLMTEHSGWRVLRKRDGEPFRTFDEFCAYERPMGLGKPYEEIRPYIEAVVGRVQAAAHATTAEAAPTKAEAGKKGGRAGGRGRPKASDNDNEPNPGPPRGTDPAYLAARIARDAPEVHERMKAGAFKSVRAAAIAAGVVKVKPKDPVRVAAKAVRNVPTHRLAELVCSLPVDTRRLLLACLKDSL